MLIPGKNILFSIPIYRQKEKEYNQYLDKQEDKFVEYNINQLIRNKVIKEDDIVEFKKKIIYDHMRINPRIRWKYNQIIGYIEFYLSGDKIKAQWWLKKSRRIPKIPGKKIFDFKGKISDVSSTLRLNNDEIKNRLISYLADLQEGKYKLNRIKNYFIDTTLFRDQLKYLDIKKWINECTNS